MMSSFQKQGELHWHFPLIVLNALGAILIVKRPESICFFDRSRGLDDPRVTTLEIIDSEQNYWKIISAEKVEEGFIDLIFNIFFWRRRLTFQSENLGKITVDETIKRIEQLVMETDYWSEPDGDSTTGKGLLSRIGKPESLEVLMQRIDDFVRAR